jgi:hypothetical protein
MSVVGVVTKGLSHYAYPFVAALLAAFALSFVSLNCMGWIKSGGTCYLLGGK